jgi:hypothetical protein
MNYDKSKEKFMNASFYMKKKESREEGTDIKDSRESTKSADISKLAHRIKPLTAESAQNVEIKKGRQQIKMR